ncbi:MAG: response regulator [Bacteroidetes bacterium]|nr:response regulator [Bacteroidota bacterium]
MKTVLVIDDAGFDRTIISAILTQSGYNVIGEAESGNEGLQMARDLKPELITLDKMMPDMDGMQVLEILHNENFPGTIVLVSGDDLASVKEKATLMGAKDFFKKPISKGDLKLRLDALFG